MSGVVLNSQFLTRLLTSGEEVTERVSLLQDTLSTACELTMLILSMYTVSQKNAPLFIFGITWSE